MKLKMLFFPVIIFSIILSNTLIFAQEDDLSDYEYLLGDVVSISQDEIVLSEIDYDSGDTKTNTYSLSPEVEIENIGATISDINEGDVVYLTLEKNDDQSFVMSISIENALEEGDLSYDPEDDRAPENENESYEDENEGEDRESLGSLSNAW